MKPLLGLSLALAGAAALLISGCETCNDVLPIHTLHIRLQTADGSRLLTFNASVQAGEESIVATCPTGRTSGCSTEGGFLVGISPNFTPETLQLEVTSPQGNFNGTIRPNYTREEDWNGSCSTLVTGEVSVTVE